MRCGRTNLSVIARRHRKCSCLRWPRGRLRRRDPLAAHAPTGAEIDAKLTLLPDHSVGADQQFVILIVPDCQLVQNGQRFFSAIGKTQCSALNMTLPDCLGTDEAGAGHRPPCLVKKDPDFRNGHDRFAGEKGDGGMNHLLGAVDAIQSTQSVSQIYRQDQLIF